MNRKGNRSRSLFIITIITAMILHLLQAQVAMTVPLAVLVEALHRGQIVAQAGVTAEVHPVSVETVAADLVETAAVSKT